MTLVDRNVYSTFQPLPLRGGDGRADLGRRRLPALDGGLAARCEFRKGELASLDLERRTRDAGGGEQLSYDYLIIATGVSAAFFGVAGAAEHSLSLYTRRTRSPCATP